MAPLLTVIGSPGDANRIEYANALGNTNLWIRLTNVVLTSAVLEWCNTIWPPGAYRFYRAVLLGSVTGTVLTRVIAPNGGTFTSPQSVTITYRTSGIVR